MEASEVRQLIERWVEAWNGKDAEDVRRFYTDDVVLYQAPVDRTLTGVDHIIDRYRDLSEMSDDSRFTIRRLHVVGDIAVLEANITGTHTGTFLNYEPTGRPLNINVCLVLDARDGKIVKHTTYLDTATILRAIGVIDIPEARPEAA